MAHRRHAPIPIKRHKANSGLRGARCRRCQRFPADHFDHLLANLNEAQLKVHQDGGIPTRLHREYPRY